MNTVGPGRGGQRERLPAGATKPRAVTGIEEDAALRQMHQAWQSVSGLFGQIVKPRCLRREPPNVGITRH